MAYFTSVQLDEIFEYHSLRSEKIWDPGDTYTVCVPCQSQVLEGSEGLCKVQKLLKMIEELQGGGNESHKEQV